MYAGCGFAPRETPVPLCSSSRVSGALHTQMHTRATKPAPFAGMFKSDADANSDYTREDTRCEDRVHGRRASRQRRMDPHEQAANLLRAGSTGPLRCSHHRRGYRASADPRAAPPRRRSRERPHRPHPLPPRPCGRVELCARPAFGPTAGCLGPGQLLVGAPTRSILERLLGRPLFAAPFDSMASDVREISGEDSF